MVKRAGLPLIEESKTKDPGRTDTHSRKEEAETRKKWEELRTSEAGEKIAGRLDSNAGARSALSRRANSEKPDLFLKSMDNRLDPQSFSEDKHELERALTEANNNHDNLEEARNQAADSAAATKLSELVALAGSGSAFKGEQIGVGGLDEVLSQIKRRVWIPLAAPPQLLEELGIHPVRGLL
jgi:ATP-dependent 26S proteasome regulatory subunit